MENVMLSGFSSAGASVSFFWAYEGRFDIGDGEGNLISHIKNFYDYSLSPNCPFIPEWKRQGEDYYREKIENLRFGRDTLLPGCCPRWQRHLRGLGTHRKS